MCLKITRFYTKSIEDESYVQKCPFLTSFICKSLFHLFLKINLLKFELDIFIVILCTLLTGEHTVSNIYVVWHASYGVHISQAGLLPRHSLRGMWREGRIRASNGSSSPCHLSCHPVYTSAQKWQPICLWPSCSYFHRILMF